MGGSAGSSAISYESWSCREFLILMLYNTEHKFAMTVDIKNQWDLVRSKIANQFLSIMSSKNRIETLDSISNNIKIEFQNLELSQNIRVSLEKDIHLIEAALEVDKIVISKDKKARLNFCIISDDLNDIKRIMWANPTVIEDDTMSWLEMEMPDDNNKKLDSSNIDYVRKLTSINVTNSNKPKP